MVRFSVMFPSHCCARTHGRCSASALSLLQGAARQHGGEMLAVVGRRVDVVHRVDRAAAFASLAEQLAGWRLAGDGLLDARARSHRRRPTPPTVTEARVIFPPPSICDSAAADVMAKSPWRRENSMKASRMAGWPEREANRGHDLVRLDRRRHVGDRKIRERDLARAVRPRDRHGRVIPQRRLTPARPPDRDGRASRRWCRGCASGDGRSAGSPRASAASARGLRSEYSRSRWRVMAPISSAPPFSRM